MEQWNDFNQEEFLFEQHKAIVVSPNLLNNNKHLVIKTEYWNAFPNAEIELVKQGYHLCYIKNNTRWGDQDSLDRQYRFIQFVQKKYQLDNKLVAVGMSCGGLCAIKLAGQHPGLVSCLYLDAPVINYLSCPCGLGIGNPLSDNNSEIFDALKLSSISELLSYRDMPLDYLPSLVKQAIPVILLVGDKDLTVPYVENGKLLQEAYTKANLPFELHVKKGCEHHPHCLPDPSPIINFINKAIN